MARTPRPLRLPARFPARSLATVALSGALFVSGPGCPNQDRPTTPPPSTPPVAAPPTVTAEEAPATPKPPTRDERSLTLFLVTQIRNTTEPCGCTSEPLGDVARLAELLHKSDGLLLDAGALRYKAEALSPAERPQARLKADFLDETWQGLGAITGLQPQDLVGPEGSAELAGRTRLATNLRFAEGTPAPQLATELVKEHRGIKLGVLALADPALPWPTGVTVSEPIPAAQQAVAKLRAAGAEVVVALTGFRRDGARRLLRKVPGIDLAVAGNDPELPDGAADPELVESGVLVVPAPEAQRVVRVELHLPKLRAKTPPPLGLQKTDEQRARDQARRKEKLAEKEAQLAKLTQDPSAEPAFVATIRGEVDKLRAEQKAAEAPPGPVGKDAAYLNVELVPIRRSLPRDAEVAARLDALDQKVGAANLEAVKALPAPAPKGQASYLGGAACVANCHFHSDSMEVWQKSLHASAYKTLVDVHKQRSYDCVHCHATGFGEVGGSNLLSLAQAEAGKPGVPDLRNVQCEVCHGPGSLHARSPSKIPVPFPKPTEERCLTCHTKDHSDTFNYAAYLRDILGPGHGADRREELGPGPTGHELRQAALKAKAKGRGGGGH